jgi:hypothetical protein
MAGGFLYGRRRQLPGIGRLPPRRCARRHPKLSESVTPPRPAGWRAAPPGYVGSGGAAVTRRSETSCAQDATSRPVMS